MLETVIPRALLAAETQQASAGGSNPRFAGIYDALAPVASTSKDVESCAIISDRPAVAAALRTALQDCSISCYQADVAHGFEGVSRSISPWSKGTVPSTRSLSHCRVTLVPQARSKAGSTCWPTTAACSSRCTSMPRDSRAVADYTAAADRPVRLLLLTEATTPAGLSRAQAAAQLARVLAPATKGRLTAFTVGLESDGPEAARTAGELTARLFALADVAPLAGAELAVHDDWLGLRSHPRPIGTVTYGGPTIPSWLDAALREIVGANGPAH